MSSEWTLAASVFLTLPLILGECGDTLWASTAFMRCVRWKDRNRAQQQRRQQVQASVMRTRTTMMTTTRKAG